MEETKTIEEIKELLRKQAEITTVEVVIFLADLCDKNRGNLSIGDMIRDLFKINKSKVEESTKEIINEVNISPKPKESTTVNEDKKSNSTRLTVIK